MNRTMSGVVCVLCVLMCPRQAAAQATDPNPGNLTLTGSFDVVSTYVFRGIRQNSTGVAMWPAADLGIALYSGAGTLKSVGVNVGTGARNVHGGVEYQALGDTTQFVNGGDGSRVIGSVGIGFTY